MVIELAGVPGGGKSTLSRAYAAARGKDAVVTLPMRRGAAISGFLRYAIGHPVHAFWLVAFAVRHHAPGLFAYSLHLALRAAAKLGQAERQEGSAPVLVDEGTTHLLCALPNRALALPEMRRWLDHLPRADAVMLATDGSFHRFHREDEHVHPRVAKGAEALAAWEAAVRENARTLEAALKEEGIPYARLEGGEAGLQSLSASVPRSLRERVQPLAVFAAFALVALCGVALSASTPYIKSDDEQVYLIGALQAEEGTLPDPEMLEGYEYGPYLYPKVLAALYEPMGHFAFKATYLVLLIFATGLAAFAALRMIGLPWIPSLLASVVALMPRAAAGTELFGAFTFREAIGREAAMPLFWVATGLIIARISRGKALWPAFVLIGLFLFLHPVTVTLYAFLALFASGIAMLFMRVPVLRIVRELLFAGLAYVIAGFYFFVKVFERIAPTGAADAPQDKYVDAILFRNAWEFPAASFDWYLHMAIVSAPLLALLAAYLLWPRIRRLGQGIGNARLLLSWGLSAMAFSLILAVLIPGLNLYAMQHFDAPYAFQQWSRISKFFYFGLFVALVPAVAVLWQRFTVSGWRWKRFALAGVVLMGLASSTFAFEVAQFAIGYANYEKAYVPQAWSGVPDSPDAADYRDTCSALAAIGAKPEDAIVSNDFGLRYYCRADLFVTQEEGAAFTYRTRAELVDWHARLLAQRAAFSTGDPEAIRAFAREVGARFVVLSHTARNEELMGSAIATTTAAHIILDASPKARAGIR